LGKLIKLPRPDEFKPNYSKFEDENKITIILEAAGVKDKDIENLIVTNQPGK